MISIIVASVLITLKVTGVYIISWLAILGIFIGINIIIPLILLLLSIIIGGK